MDNEEDVLARKDNQYVDALFSKTQTISEGEAASNSTFLSQDDLDVNVFNTRADQVEKDQGSNELLLQSVEEEVFELGHIWIFFGLIFILKVVSLFADIFFSREFRWAPPLYVHLSVCVCVCLSVCPSHLWVSVLPPPCGSVSPLCVSVTPTLCFSLPLPPSAGFCVPTPLYASVSPPKLCILLSPSLPFLFTSKLSLCQPQAKSLHNGVRLGGVPTNSNRVVIFTECYWRYNAQGLTLLISLFVCLFVYSFIHALLFFV